MREEVEKKIDRHDYRTDLEIVNVVKYSNN